MQAKFEQILGVNFLDAEVEVALRELEKGGLMVVPSGPGLATLPKDELYRRALEGADLAIVDSAYLALLWFAVTGKRLHRVSGLELIRAFLHFAPAKEPGALFLVNPTDADEAANVALLQANGFAVSDDDCYTAPVYEAGAIVDAALVARIEAQRPRYVMLNIGGGIQEPLGHYLKSHLSYAPAILCTGAAIAFVTGRQATISERVDALGLGWLARCVREPRKFVPRYLSAFKLGRLVVQHRRSMPPLDARTDRPA